MTTSYRLKDSIAFGTDSKAKRRIFYVASSEYFSVLCKHRCTYRKFTIRTISVFGCRQGRVSQLAYNRIIHVHTFSMNSQ
jgi:predicted nucleic-acid-binding Zn-ribbon protein